MYKKEDRTVEYIYTDIYLYQYHIYIDIYVLLRIKYRIKKLKEKDGNHNF